MGSLAMKTNWTPRRIWRRAREVLREQGWASLWFKVLGETIYRRAWVAVRPLDQIDLRRQPPPELEIRELDVAELEPFLALHPEGDRHELRARLEAGERCFIGFWSQRPVHSSWVARKRARLGYLDRWVELADDEAYYGEVFTAAEFRRRGVSAAVTVEVARRLRREGCRCLYAVLMPENRLGSKATWKWKRAGVLRAIRLGPWRLHLGKLSGAAAEDSVGRQWTRALERIEEGGHYLDPFLGELKRSAHLRLLQSWGGPRPGGRLLKTDLFEEAVGPDAFLAEAARGFAESVGMDISAAVVQRARARAGASPSLWVVADVRSLPFRQASFSTIVSTSTLDHFGQPGDLGRSLGELRSALAPEGRLVVTLDNRANLFDPLLRFVGWVGLAPFFVGRSYTIAELRRELVLAGFEVLECTAILHNPRLVAVGAMRLARWTRVAAIETAMKRLLTAAQGLEQTRLRYLTGSFVAAAGRPVSSR